MLQDINGLRKILLGQRSGNEEASVVVLYEMLVKELKEDFQLETGWQNQKKKQFLE